MTGLDIITSKMIGLQDFVRTTHILWESAIDLRSQVMKTVADPDSAEFSNPIWASIA